MDIVRRTMPDKENIKKTIAGIKKDMTARLSQVQDPKKDIPLRSLRKRLKRAQRKLRFLEGKKGAKKEGKTPPPAAPAPPAGS